MQCSVEECSFDGFEESGGGTEVDVGGDEPVFFPGCPLKHAVDEEANMWIFWFQWLKNYSKTPVEVGAVTRARLDPRYFAAMELVRVTDAELRKKE